jgi:hypothetical protein
MRIVDMHVRTVLIDLQHSPWYQSIGSPTMPTEIPSVEVVFRLLSSPTLTVADRRTWAEPILEAMLDVPRMVPEMRERREGLRWVAGIMSGWLDEERRKWFGGRREDDLLVRFVGEFI